MIRLLPVEDAKAFINFRQIENKINVLDRLVNSLFTFSSEAPPIIGAKPTGSGTESLATAAPAFQSSTTTKVGSANEVVRVDAQFPHVSTLNKTGGTAIVGDVEFNDTATISVTRTGQIFTWDVDLTALSGTFVRRDGTTTMTAEWPTGNHFQWNDNLKLKLGTGSDVEVYFDASNLIVEPRAVGGGYVTITGGLNLTQPGGYADLPLLTVGGLAGTPYSGSQGVYIAMSSGDNNLIGCYVAPRNSQTSSATNYTTTGIQVQANLRPTGTRGNAKGGFFYGRLDTTSNTAFAGGGGAVTGGDFRADSTGACDNNSGLAFTAGYFQVQPGVGRTGNSWTQLIGNRIIINPTGTSNTATAVYGYWLSAFSNTGVGNSWTNAYGFYCVDLTDLQNTPTNLDVFHIEAQNGSAAGATRGNIRFAGGNYNTGHLQLENSHIWTDPTNNTVQLYGATPTATTDGLGITGNVIAPAGSTGTITNGPWTTTPKDPTTYLEIYRAGTRYAVPAYDLT